LVCYIVQALNVLTNAANFQQFIKPKFSQDAVFSATFDSLYLQAAGRLWRYVQIQWPTNPTLHKWFRETVVIN